jgi:hypothetical protein
LILMDLTFNGETWPHVAFHRQKYADGSDALKITTEFELLCVASVNLFAYDLRPSAGCFFVKDYAETRGLPNALEVAGVMQRTGRVEFFGGFDAKAVEMRFVE